MAALARVDALRVGDVDHDANAIPSGPAAAARRGGRRSLCRPGFRRSVRTRRSPSCAVLSKTIAPS